jgi:outer membrane protein assembly factor BamA
LGGSLELNELDVFSDVTALREQFPNLLNIPDGLTLAVAQRIGVTWDRRDNSVAATRGTLLSVNLEHVNAFPLEDSSFGTSSDLTSDYKGHFLQYTGRVAGYVRLTERGVALATSLRFGFNQQLEEGSATYPDRLFYLGGVDSLRGFPLWSVVPEDLNRTLVDEGDIPIRGGDVLINPRAELRIPIVDVWQTAVFLDTGNLWADADEVFDTFRLRYSAGMGLRVNTPVGPLALDYGINLAPRSYEDFGAFHFSIGLF